MASGVDELLDMLYQMIDEAKNVPLSSDKCMLDRDRALDLLDEIRAQFPMELTEAKKLMALMGLGVKQGETVTVSIEGGDEELVAAEMEEFFKNNL